MEVLAATAGWPLAALPLRAIRIPYQLHRPRHQAQNIRHSLRTKVVMMGAKPTLIREGANMAGWFAQGIVGATAATLRSMMMMDLVQTMIMSALQIWKNSLRVAPTLPTQTRVFRLALRVGVGWAKLTRNSTLRRTLRMRVPLTMAVAQLRPPRAMVAAMVQLQRHLHQEAM